MEVNDCCQSPRQLKTKLLFSPGKVLERTFMIGIKFLPTLDKRNSNILKVKPDSQIPVVTKEWIIFSEEKGMLLFNVAMIQFMWLKRMSR